VPSGERAGALVQPRAVEVIRGAAHGSPQHRE
jgi:hypothetical protein